VGAAGAGRGDRVRRRAVELTLLGGLALRFARVKRHHPDKSAIEAEAIDAVRAIHARGRE
jgi:hypothetical protein